MFRVIIATALIALLAGPAVAQQPTKRSQAPEGVVLYFINLRDGMHLYPHFTVRFGLKGMGVAPAGVEKAATGHHHLLIDSDITNFDEPIPNDRNHLHYGAGLTEAEVDLPPGKHTLQLVLGNEDHMAFDPPIVSKKITVTVVKHSPKVAAQ